jgi:hypothetical protein
VDTVTSPQSSVQAADPVPTGAFDFLEWLFGDQIRARWGLIYLVVCLTAVVLVTWLLAPHIGSILSTLVGAVAGAGGGDLLIGTTRRRGARTTASSTC